MAAAHTGRMIPERPNRPVKIVLKGYFGAGNFGDDILLHVVSGAVKQVTDTPIVLSCSKEASYLRHHSHGPFDIRRHSAPVFDSHILVYAGGGQFFGFRQGSTLEFIRQQILRRFGFKVARQLTAAMGGKRKMAGSTPSHIAAVGVSVGPFVRGSASEYAAALRLGECGHITVRDEASSQQIRRWKLNAAVSCLPDLSFAYRRWSRSYDDTGARSGRPAIGIILRRWLYSDEEWVSNLRNAASQLKESGYAVDFVSLCSSDDGPTLNTLAPTEKLVAYDPERTSIDEFAKQLSEYDLIISGRAHGVFTAAIFNIPCIAIELEPKLTLATNTTSFNSGSWKHPWDAENLVAKVNSMINRRSNTDDQRSQLLELELGAETAISDFQHWLKGVL